MLSKDADRMANTVDPDQTASQGAVLPFLNKKYQCI